MENHLVSNVGNAGRRSMHISAESEKLSKTDYKGIKQNEALLEKIKKVEHRIREPIDLKEKIELSIDLLIGLPKDFNNNDQIDSIVSFLTKQGMFVKKTLLEDWGFGKKINPKLIEMVERSIVNGNTNIAISFLKNGFPLTPNLLFLVCRSNNVELMTKLIEGLNSKEFNMMDDTGTSHISLNLNMLDHAGDSLLHIACRQGSRDMALKLIELGVDINGKDEFARTPLAIACDGHSEDLALMLIRNGADVNTHDIVHQTPLHIACQEGLEIVALALMLHGANFHKDVEGDGPNLSKLSPKSKEAALLHACKTGLDDLAKALLAAGPEGVALLKKSCSQSAGCDMAKKLIELGVDISAVDLKDIKHDEILHLKVASFNKEIDRHLKEISHPGVRDKIQACLNHSLMDCKHMQAAAMMLEGFNGLLNKLSVNLSNMLQISTLLGIDYQEVLQKAIDLKLSHTKPNDLPSFDKAVDQALSEVNGRAYSHLLQDGRGVDSDLRAAFNANPPKDVLAMHKDFSMGSKSILEHPLCSGGHIPENMRCLVLKARTAGMIDEKAANEIFPNDPFTYTTAFYGRATKLIELFPPIVGNLNPPSLLFGEKKWTKNDEKECLQLLLKNWMPSVKNISDAEFKDMLIGLEKLISVVKKLDREKYPPQLIAKAIIQVADHYGFQNDPIRFTNILKNEQNSVEQLKNLINKVLEGKHASPKIPIQNPVAVQLPKAPPALKENPSEWREILNANAPSKLLVSYMEERKLQVDPSEINVLLQCMAKKPGGYSDEIAAIALCRLMQSKHKDNLRITPIDEKEFNSFCFEACSESALSDLKMHPKQVEGVITLLKTVKGTSLPLNKHGQEALQSLARQVASSTFTDGHPLDSDRVLQKFPKILAEMKLSSVSDLNGCPLDAATMHKLLELQKSQFNDINLREFLLAFASDPTAAASTMLKGLVTGLMGGNKLDPQLEGAIDAIVSQMNKIGAFDEVVSTMRLYVSKMEELNGIEFDLHISTKELVNLFLGEMQKMKIGDRGISPPTNDVQAFLDAAASKLEWKEGIQEALKPYIGPIGLLASLSTILLSGPLLSALQGILSPSLNIYSMAVSLFMFAGYAIDQLKTPLMDHSAQYLFSFLLKKQSESIDLEIEEINHFMHECKNVAPDTMKGKVEMELQRLSEIAAESSLTPEMKARKAVLEGYLEKGLDLNEKKAALTWQRKVIEGLENVTPQITEIAMQIGKHVGEGKLELDISTYLQRDGTDGRPLIYPTLESLLNNIDTLFPTLIENAILGVKDVPKQGKPPPVLAPEVPAAGRIEAERQEVIPTHSQTLLAVKDGKLTSVPASVVPADKSIKAKQVVQQRAIRPQSTEFNKALVTEFTGAVYDSTEEKFVKEKIIPCILKEFDGLLSSHRFTKNEIVAITYLIRIGYDIHKLFGASVEEIALACRLYCEEMLNKNEPITADRCSTFIGVTAENRQSLLPFVFDAMVTKMAAEVCPMDMGKEITWRIMNHLSFDHANLLLTSNGKSALEQIIRIMVIEDPKLMEPWPQILKEGQLNDLIVLNKIDPALVKQRIQEGREASKPTSLDIGKLLSKVKDPNPKQTQMQMTRVAKPLVETLFEDQSEREAVLDFAAKIIASVVQLSGVQEFKDAIGQLNIQGINVGINISLPEIIEGLQHNLKHFSRDLAAGKMPSYDESFSYGILAPQLVMLVESLAKAQVERNLFPLKEADKPADLTARFRGILELGEQRIGSIVMNLIASGNADKEVREARISELGKKPPNERSKAEGDELILLQMQDLSPPDISYMKRAGTHVLKAMSTETKLIPPLVTYFNEIAENPGMEVDQMKALRLLVDFIVDLFDSVKTYDNLFPGIIKALKDIQK